MGGVRRGSGGVGLVPKRRKCEVSKLSLQPRPRRAAPAWLPGCPVITQGSVPPPRRSPPKHLGTSDLASRNTSQTQSQSVTMTRTCSSGHPPVPGQSSTSPTQDQSLEDVTFSPSYSSYCLVFSEAERTSLQLTQPSLPEVKSQIPFFPLLRVCMDKRGRYSQVKCTLCQLLNKFPTDTCFQNALEESGTMQVGGRKLEVQAGLGVGTKLCHFPPRSFIRVLTRIL